MQFIAPTCVKICCMSNYKRYFSSSNNLVFLTFVTYNRNEILLHNIDLLRKSFKYALSKFHFEIIAISILKEHCHLILVTKNSKNIPSIIRTIKYYFSLNIEDKYVYKNLTNSAIKRGEKGIWQRRYYDHIIRDEEDLYKHVDYIHYNSMKHYKIPPKDWAYSSFKKFVQNKYYDIDWCNFKDKHKINLLDYE